MTLHGAERQTENEEMMALYSHGQLMRKSSPCTRPSHSCQSVTDFNIQTIRTMRWHPHSILPSPVDHEHECINWEAIDEWAGERFVDTSIPGLLVHPTKGKLHIVLAGLANI
ncbi:hypothetical protein K431DRAFT_280701, partial [Polychaeton citri CBS 116435]